MPHRREFLTGLGATIASAPAIVRSASILPAETPVPKTFVYPLWQKEFLDAYANGRFILKSRSIGMTSLTNAILEYRLKHNEKMFVWEGGVAS